MEHSDKILQNNRQNTHSDRAHNNTHSVLTQTKYFKRRHKQK